MTYLSAERTACPRSAAQTVISKPVGSHYLARLRVARSAAVSKRPRQRPLSLPTWAFHSEV